jgi:hypothetical protein
MVFIVLSWRQELTRLAAPNDADHRPGASNGRHETETLSPGSVHPFLFGDLILHS